MRFNTIQLLIGMLAATAVVGCTQAGKITAQPTQSYVGWYMQRAGQGVFQSCGQAEQQRITASADLDARARAFGLQPDTPVYVRLTGSLQGDQLAVARVDQFGSSTPVRDCAMTGVVIPDP